MPRPTPATDQQEQTHSARRAAEQTPAAAPDLQRLPAGSGKEENEKATG